nr:MAG TPA: crystallin beta/gamma motif-containing protein [Caudoviricetes sp.]
MAFDLEGYLQEGREEREQREAAQAEREAKEANQAEWEAKPFYSKAATIISEDVGAIADAAGDRLGKIKDAYSAYYEAQAASRDKYGIYIPTPEVQEAGDNLRGVVLEPVTHPIKSFVGGYINQKADEGSTIAQNVRNTETFTHYFMTPEDKLKKAKEIEDTTGISSDAFINDDVAYKQALNVYDYKRAKAAVMPEDQAMEAVWQEFPELRNVSLTNPTEAALALHDMDSVRQTHGIVETFNHFIALGNKELEYNNLQYKIMTNRADDNDRERAADLERMIAEDKKAAPSFFDDPLSAIVGGMASSGPEMLQSIREGVRDGLITAEAAAIAGAALGTGVEPLGGTLVGGAAGAGAGFTTGFVRSVFGSAARRQAMRTAITRGMQFGAFEGMRRPETGSRYAEYGNMKDTDGNPLLTDNDRRLYAALGGAANAGIEMANFGIATKPLSRGAVNFLTKGGTDKYAVDAIKGVVDAAKYDVAKRESVAAFAKAQVKDTLKIAATESAEEGAQSIADDLIHNRIVDASDGRAADKAYSIGDIAANALVASVEAIPAGLGFGMASSLGGGSLGSVRHARRLFSEKAKEELAAQKTMTGTVMLNRLQQVASSAKLKETAPDVQQKIIRTQVQGTGFENAYIDTAMAVKKENGLADLKEVAKTAGIREEELQKTIESGGHLFVPAEKYAQSAASPQLLESVSFSPETDSAARMKENAKMLSDALETAQKRAVHARADIVKSIADEYFPEVRENLDEHEKARLYSERDMAKAVIAQNTESPAEGWRSLYNDFTAARDEILQPAMDALSKGMKQGVDILPLGEDGRGIRVSNNAPWYQEYYKQHGKAPNQAQLRDLAYLLTVGDASAPNVEGWIPTTREAAEAMDAARGELDELNGHIQTLENIKERMMKVDSFEVKGSAGLSPEGYKLYRQIMEMLAKIGGQQKEDKQTKVARMNAMLFAHHADIFAAAMRTQEGKEKYTALDYFRDRFALRYGGTDMRSNEDVLHQAVRAGLNLDEQVQVVGFDTLVNDLKGKSDKEIIAYISKLSRTEPIPVADFKALVGLPKDNDRYGQRHLIRGKANQSAANRAARNTVLSNFRDVVQHAVVVEVVPNTKKKSLHGLQGAKWRTQKRKNEVENYYRLMVPVRINGRIRTLVIVAEEHNGVVSSPTSVKVYEIYYAKKHPLATAPITETSSKAGAKAGVSVAEEDALSTISIRDMLTGVKDADGNVYAQSAWHGSPHDFVEFLLSAIGTGEGAQAHGWGLYLAEKREAASGYGGKLYHVEIPDNDVLIDEQKAYDAQPAKVRKSLEKLVHGLTLEQLENWNDVRRLGKAKVIAEIMDTLSESDGMNIYGTISDLVDGQQEASELLNQYGIKGITYHDEQSGRGFVVFDDKAISIIEKFNQMLRQEVRGEISKEDGKRIITLFESADESTFMHEMGHMFLMDLDELAKMDEASAKELETVNAWAEWHEDAAEEYKDTDFADEFRAHENAILAAKKSGDAVAEKAALERWRQERFARGFEMYLSEGKAPSAAMRSVFRRFKAFLRKIYNLAKNAGAMPSVEVQAVMARMIATENEITEAKLDERFRPIEKLLGKESVESLLGETEAELYKRWTQEAQEEAEDILRKRVMKDLEKEAREEFNQKIEAERERKRAELENDPVYLAEYAMRQGGSTDVVMNWFPSYAAYKKARGKRKTLEEELQKHVDEYVRKLDEQIMQEHLSDENVARAMQTPKAYHRRLAIESAALRRKERLMRLLGGNAPEEVKKKAVAEAKKAESPTRRGTKQEVRKEYERSAYEHERFMREEARAYLREREISESCNPRFFRRNERKYARAMDKAAAAGKWSDVLALKEQQAFAAACAYEAERNEARLNKLLEGVKRKLSARTVRLAADERYWLNHIGYLLGLKANDEEKPVKCAKISELFARYKENIDIDACDPSDLLDVITEGKKRYQEMQLDDFADIVNALGILYNVGRRRNEMLTKSMQGKTTDDILGEIFTDDTLLKPTGIVEHPVSEDTGGVGYGELLAKTPFVGKVLAKYGQEGSLLLTKPELIMRLLGEKAHRYLYGTYDRAQMKESEILGEKQKALEKIFSVYTRKERMKWKDRNIDAHGDMLSKENVLCLAMNWGTFTNRKRVLDGVGQKFDVIRTLHENMTEKDWKVVQEVWNLVDTFWEESARTEERLNGARVGKVPASAFTIETADGKEVTLKGGYYPLRYNAEKSSNVQDKTAEEAAKGTMTGAQVFGTKRGHTKARVEGDVVLPVRLEFGVLQEHVYNAAHNIAFRIAARDVYRIINDKEFEAYVSSNYGRPVYKYLKQWAVDVWAIPADGTDLAGSAISRALAAFRRNSTMAIMGWRMWPVVENVSNIAPVVDKLGARRALQAVIAFALHPKTLLAMSKKSIFMADRINNMERDVRRDSHTFDPTYKPLEFLRDNAYRALSFTDLALSVPTWNSAYNEAFPKALAQINEENEANKRTYQEAQNRVHELRAEVYDLRREMEEVVDPLLQEIIREKNKERIREMKKHVREKKERIRAKEKEFAEAGIALERAGELPIYDEAERIREAEMRAVQAGDAAVRDTFGSGQTKDLAAIQRSRNEAVKMFTSFYSFFNTQFNAVLESYYGGKYNADGYRHIRVWMPFARSVLYRIILVGLIGGLGKAALGLEGDDDRDKYRNVVDPKTGKTTKVEVPWEERWMNVIGKNTVSTATGMIPIVRDLIGMVTDALFDGTTRGRNFEVGSVVSRGGKQAMATWNLIRKKGEDDLKREAEKVKERERVKKMTKKQREKYEEEKKYKKPKKEVGYVDIAKSAAQTVSTFTASRHGITNTPSDGLFSIAQFAVDMMETDNYYDPDIRNVLRAVFFDKKLREKEAPKKPEPPKKKQRRTRGRKERTND